MKKLLLPLIVLMLVSCGNTGTSTSVSSSSLSFPSVPSVDPSKEEIKRDEDGNYLLDFYSTNDFHGACEYNLEEDEPGLARIATYLNDAKYVNPGGTIALSSGDMWQGSCDSNVTKGELVIDAMNAMGFVSQTIGNHEFDWKVSTIQENVEKMNFPLLACNIKDKSKSTASETVMMEEVEPYVVFQREDLKIAIIGSIGEGLTSSILASNVENYEFLNPTTYVINYAKQLRNDGVDIIAYSTHQDKSSIDVSIAPYVDCIFTGHTHKEYEAFIDGVPVIQSGENGNAIGHIQLAYNKATKTVVDVNKNENIHICDLYLEEDPTVKSIYDYHYNRTIKAVKEEKVGTVSADKSSSTIISKLTKIMYEKYKADDSNVLVACHNAARSTLSKGDVTYGDIYKCLPFDNYICKVKMLGKYVSAYIAHCSTYPTKISLDYKDDQTYTIINIDYLEEKYHVTESTLEKINIFPRDILAEAFRNHPTHNPLD